MHALVRTNPDAPKHKGITFLLVDMHSPGVTVRPLRQISGDEDFNEVFFDDVRVPRANVIGADRRRLGHRHHVPDARAADADLQPPAAVARGAQRHARHGAPRIRGAAAARPARCARSSPPRTSTAHAMRYTALPQPDQGAARRACPGPEGSIEKLFWSEMYQRQLETALDDARARTASCSKGSPHAVDEGRWPHLMLYSRGRTIAAGTSEMQRNIIAERVLRLPRA